MRRSREATLQPQMECLPRHAAQQSRTLKTRTAISAFLHPHEPVPGD
jgi:hypothetical protein